MMLDMHPISQRIANIVICRFADCRHLFFSFYFHLFFYRLPHYNLHSQNVFTVFFQICSTIFPDKNPFPGQSAAGKGFFRNSFRLLPSAAVASLGCGARHLRVKRQVLCAVQLAGFYQLRAAGLTARHFRSVRHSQHLLQLCSNDIPTQLCV